MDYSIVYFIGSWVTAWEGRFVPFPVHTLLCVSSAWEEQGLNAHDIPSLIAQSFGFSLLIFLLQEQNFPRGVRYE